jgi:hypothetical protein
VSKQEAEALINRTFSIGEVMVLLAFEMGEWHTRTARECFIEMGGIGAVFDRLVTRLEGESIIRQHPRRGDHKMLDQLCEGLRLRYEMAALAQEAR